MEQKLSSIDERTEKIENVEEKLSFIDERTDEIHTMMKNMCFGEKKNIPETLPKPYVPSPVPFFTGREDEIEEITNLITGQSTRLLNIWGSPGFGKTSTAIEAARHLLSLGLPVYFFKYQGIKTVDEFLSKILSIFKSNLTDRSLRPIDKVVSIFREILCRIFLIFDNLDDLLSSERSSVKLARLFEELLDSNVNINIVFTTREHLENMCDLMEGFRDIRIRPLHPVSSAEFVRQLLSSFSDSIVANVARISSNVPLAMKLVASIVENNNEDIANKILEELSLSRNLLEIESSYEQSMKKLFEIPFEQLSLTDKHALISLSVFPSSRISKDAAINVVFGEMAVAKVLRSLKALVKKSLIDEDPCGEYYSIHPLIHSFVVDKAKEKGFENIFQSSRIRFCTYYFLLFERINDYFLSGKSVDTPQLQDAMEHLSIAIHYFTTSTCSLENCQDLFRILCKSEIFLFLIALPSVELLDIPKLYDFAIEKCRTQQHNEAYSKLHVSKYFRRIAFPQSSKYFEIPKRIRENVMLLSDGSAAKLGCYEGISLISEGNIKSGIECIEKYVDGLQNCADQQLIKCLCLQLLTLFYTDHLKEYSKSSKLNRETIDVCKEIGNYNLFLISNCDETSSMMQREYKDEQLILFVYLLYVWSKQIVSDETQIYFLNFVHQLEQQLENKAYNASPYLVQIFAYGDCILAALGVRVGQEVLLDEKITFLEKSVMSDDCCSLTGTTFPIRSEMSVNLFSARLLNFYNLQIAKGEKQGVSVDTCRNALDLSLKQYGEQQWNTAVCYLNMGLAENDADNFIAALNAFDQALGIMKATHDGSSSCNADLAKFYIGIGEAYMYLNKFESAAASFEEALRIKRKFCDEDTEEIAQILLWLGHSQFGFNDLSSRSGLATYQQALQIWETLYAEKPRSIGYISCVVQCYCIIGQVHIVLGNNTESIKCFKTALEISTDGDQGSAMQSFICMHLIELKVDEILYTELLESSLPLIKESHRSSLPIIYLRLGSIQFESEKYKAGLAFLQEALDIELEVTLRSHHAIRRLTVLCSVAMIIGLNNIGKFKLARKVIDRAILIAESLPEGTQHIWIFRCYTWKGRIQNQMRKYITAIDSLKHALLQLPNISDETCDKFEEFECHCAIATAYFNVGSYKDALTSFYDALSVTKYLFPEGSEAEAQVYLIVVKVAQKMKNKTLEVSNLRLAYKMYSNVLGETHFQTQVTYIAYVRALIGLG
ncbi:WD repeat-containing alr2800 [Paramuricea clavata]|uniref:WD repeat-containing alr2800, partial n=1 Tax=Paramuricea clavata TaxID=317549 RepID=A0A7D9E381_PARCT|nr:WD repeat-containing alr2800 [Paramuricea clavata]